MKPTRSLQDADVSVVRLRLFALVVFTLLMVLVARLWFLQIVRGDELRARAESNRRLTVRTLAPRGIMEDVKGRPLVTNTAQFTVFVNPTDLPKKKAEKEVIFQRLATILELTPEKLQEIIKRKRSGGGAPIPVAEGITQHVLARIAENRLLLPGIEVDVEPIRQYPQGSVAAHVLGYIGEIQEGQLKDPDARRRGYSPGDLMGQSGLERQYDHLLHGKKGEQAFEVDARNRRQATIGSNDPVPGATLRLNLNLDVQKAAEIWLQGKKGAAVAIDPNTGAVIAMASAPTFNPNLLARRPLKASVYNEQVKPFQFPRAMQGQAPPGSTFKLVTSAASLATGASTEHTYFPCQGGTMVGGRFKRCHKSHGSVNLEMALAGSCDVYYYKTGVRMGPNTIAEWAQRFGLGEKTGIDLPHEARGRIPTPEWRRKYVARHGGDPQWYAGETANVAIGQGDVMCTPLQMAQVVAAIANGGTVYTPRVVQEARHSLEPTRILYKATPKVTHRLNLAPKHIQEIQKGLRRCVAGSGGTAHAINLRGVTVAGKTGSAEKRGGAKKESHAWFVCYAPYENPQIAICVFLESDNGQNYHGGADASPIARAMLAKYFGISEETR